MHEQPITPPAAKPHVARVELPDGRIRLVGVSDAARWLGCTQQALSAVAKGIPDRGERLRRRAMAEFPGLFSINQEGVTR